MRFPILSSPILQAVRSQHLIFTAVAALVFSLGSGVLVAQVEDTPGPAWEEQTVPGLDEQDEYYGYPAEEREFGNPEDIEQDLNNSLPKQDSVLPQLKPQGWADFKKQLYKKHGLKLGLSYQGIYQVASESLTEQDTAAAGWVLLQLKWEAINRGKDFEGSLVLAYDGRHTFGNNAVPGLFRLETGSLWATDAAWFEWDPYMAVAFWEQWLKKDRFVLRLGQQASASVLDFFRFGDFRTSFSNSQIAAPPSLIPFGPNGPGLSFKWWPVEDSEMYVLGTFTDTNAPAGEWDWGRLTEYGQIFSGVEVGMNWRRGQGDFDHAHLTMWYGGEKDTAPYPTEDGWGFKVHGSKQWGSWVGFANYAYNNSYGGGFGFTNTRQAVNAGFGYQKPLGIRGEIAMSLSWAEPLDRPDPILGIRSDRNQYGLETNWKILLTPDHWITPGVQLIWSPSFSPSTDFLAIPQIKFRVFF